MDEYDGFVEGYREMLEEDWGLFEEDRGILKIGYGEG